MAKAPKYFIVTLLIQSLFMGLFLVYALVQRTQANRQREYAVEAEKLAKENERKAIANSRALEECRQRK